MRSIYPTALLIVTCLFVGACSDVPPKSQTNSEQEIVLSSIRGQKSKPGIIKYHNSGGNQNDVQVSIEGEHAGFWKVLSEIPDKIGQNQRVEITVSFQPDTSFIGNTSGSLALILDETAIIYSLRGLSTKALEGKNEPPLADVTKALGYDIDLGWTSLGNHLRPELQGSEIPQSLFKKVGQDDVEMIPVARYSPRFSLPFGYYTIEAEKPELHEIGALAMTVDYPEHQTLFPALETGETTFDPGNSAFGFFTTSPTHVAYSENIWNELFYPDHATHAVRIYAIKTISGDTRPNQYLVCFEEARNGDYQDYVFLVKNVQAMPIEL